VTPVVGIPLGLDDRGRWRPGRDYQYLDAAYARAVEAAGGVPVLLPIHDRIRETVAGFDALLLPGGDDFPPPDGRVYPDDAGFDPVPERQRAFDAALLAEALARSRPVLAICYGMQLLALESGGSLHYHLPSDCPTASPHRLPEPAGRHAVRASPGTRLADVLGDTPVEVNSLHHQAVAEPGAGLRIAARAEDGVIEAIEGDGDAFIVGVQWHPEKLPPSAAGSGALFRALVRACG
jgi:putative glutamine amidotransferase